MNWTVSSVPNVDWMPGGEEGLVSDVDEVRYADKALAMVRRCEELPG